MGIFFKRLMIATAENFNVAKISVNNVYSTKANLRLVESVKATPYIAF
jgi:hypothetical protein